MATLYDARGQPVQTAALKREHSAPKGGTVRHESRSSQASTLTPARLGRLLREADDGNTEAYCTLADEVEERDMHYRSVLQTRKLAVSGVEVMVEAPTDGARDRRIADDMKATIVDSPAFDGLIVDLLDGLSKGLSIVEILWETSASEWRPVGYEHRSLRWFTWAADDLRTPLLPTDANPMGEPLPAFKYAIHAPKLKSGIPIRSGLARTAMGGLLLKSFSIRDWAAFMETFGMPMRLGKYGPNASAEDKDALLRAVLGIAADYGAIIPESMNLEFKDARGGNGGEKLFQGAADWWNKELSKLVLGQTMTTEDGSSLAQAKIHNDVRLDIRKADARSVSATISRDIVAPYVALNYGPTIRPPRVRLVIEEPEDLEKWIKTVGAFVDLGGRVEESVVRDRLGLPEPAAEAVLLQRKPSATPATQSAATADAGANP